jgi:hypothetical protein
VQQLVVGRHQDGRLALVALGADRAAYLISQNTPNGVWDTGQLWVIPYRRVVRTAAGQAAGQRRESSCTPYRASKGGWAHGLTRHSSAN